jgi:hypothetical protein
VPEIAPDPRVIDQLELELRQLAGVTFVAFADRSGVTVIEVAAEAGSDTERLQAEATRLALAQVDGEVVVEMVDAVGAPAAPGDGRVRLLVTLPVGAGRSVEVHLAHRGRRATVEAGSEDRLAVADAVIAGLAMLGLGVPYEPVAAHALSPDLGSGTLVILEDATTGQSRRGLASGRTPADSTARAVLNALNRVLQASSRPPVPPS